MEAKDNENNVEEIKNQVNINENENQNEELAAKWKQVQPQKGEKQEKTKKPIITVIKRIVIVGILLALAIFILDTSKYYKNDDIVDKTNVIINNNNVTARLKKDIIIENDEIYMSMQDIRNFFDNYIYEETSQNRIITI